MSRVCVNSVYIFMPVGWDVFRPCTPAPTKLQHVRVVNLPGCPKANTMGMAHVEDAATGEFAGLVLTASLVPAPS